MFAKRLRGIIGILLSLCILFAFSGCDSGEAASSEAQASSSEAVELTDEFYVDTFLMVDTLDVIYSETSELLLESVSTPTDEEIEEVLRLSLNYLDDYYIRYSSGSFGLADVYVIKPAKEHKSDHLYTGMHSPRCLLKSQEMILTECVCTHKMHTRLRLLHHPQ